MTVDLKPLNGTPMHLVMNAIDELATKLGVDSMDLAHYIIADSVLENALEQSYEEGEECTLDYIRICEGLDEEDPDSLELAADSWVGLINCALNHLEEV